ncbi:MAG: SUMF1/EgtB/PvdO family nonheme iron enzyme [Chitinophagales bacterium]|nr:SUMF1/EgtB/PvdO family nonheme iron enzyme [Chitinophagales bacterium]
MMKFRLLSITFLSSLLLIMSCSSGSFRGQLLGALDRPAWNPVMPYGMIYVPSGTLHIGPSDQDVNAALVQRAKSISIQGFYMDETEITNNEYRQFTHWVRDSIAHTLLEHFLETDDYDSDRMRLDWDMEIDWEGEDADMLEEMYYPASQQFWGRKEIDKSKLIYEYWLVDFKQAAKRQNAKVDRSEFFKRKTCAIYPDTLVWVRDFTYSYNEPMTRHYFNHIAFDDYPVVGISWDQATAFNVWRSKFWEAYRKSRNEAMMDEFRLPTEHEWEYAARGGKKLAPYPWGGPYVRNSKGCILANFKPGRGAYPEDGGLYTVRADAYWPNDYGLYNMAGNVAEWTSTAYFENSYSFIHDLNPEIRFDAQDSDSKTKKRKVVRGGSWKDIGYYIQTGSRHYEYIDSTKSYVGFRSVSTYLGRDHYDN